MKTIQVSADRRRHPRHGYPDEWLGHFKLDDGQVITVQGWDQAVTDAVVRAQRAYHGEPDLEVHVVWREQTTEEHEMHWSSDVIPSGWLY